MDSDTFYIGDLKCHLIRDGTFWLDGGAMFGVVPKVLWNKCNPADDMNRIKLALNCLVVEHSDGTILVDTGLGQGLRKRFKEMYRVQRERSFTESLRAHSIEPEQIRFVINTHLHFDHCGGNTVKQNDQWQPAFPNAQYIVHEMEWHDAVQPNERTRASYLPHTFLPVQEAGCAKLISDTFSLVPGITVMRTNGHTRGHQSVLIASEGEKALYLGDLIPTASHIKIPYTMGYDLYPMELVQTKKKLLHKAAQEHWLLIFEHDPRTLRGYVREENGTYYIIHSE